MLDYWINTYNPDTDIVVIVLKPKSKSSAYDVITTETTCGVRGLADDLPAFN